MVIKNTKKMNILMEKEKFKKELPPFDIFLGIFAIIAGFLLPLILIPVVKFTGYSEVIEEIAKALIILLLILKIPSHKKQILVGILFGLFFGISENFLYLNQIFQLGDLSVFWQRFIYTVPMHIITVLIMLFTGISKKWLLIFGLICAIILHIIFNSFVMHLFA